MPIGNNWGNPKYVKGHRPLTKVFGNPVCVMCGVMKTQKRNKDGKLETPYLMMRRKTCGNEWDGNKYIKSDCLIKYLTGELNPNYKGYMPKCKACGKRISYMNADEMAQGKTHRYCLKHAKQSFKSGELHDEILNRNRELGKNRRGIMPEHLKPYAFNKGMKPWNIDL